MAPFLELTAALDRAIEANDQALMRELRGQIVAHSPNSPEAAEAQYKLALDLLFVAKNLPQSVAMLEAATKGAHPFWVACARTSLALCYLQQKRQQKALFELRRVGYSKTPSSHSITALTFMETILAQDHKVPEAEQVRKDRQSQLRQLLQSKGEGALSDLERGHYLHQLALSCAPQTERDKARAALAEAASLGAQALGPELWQAVQHSLAQEAQQKA